MRPAEKDQVALHLSGCKGCNEYFEELQRMWEVLGGLPEIHAMPGFELKVHDKVAEFNDRRFIHRLRQIFQLGPAPLTMATFLVIGLLIGAYLGNFLVAGGFSPFPPTQSIYSSHEVTLASVRIFDAIPPGSLASGYARMASYAGGERDEK